MLDSVKCALCGHLIDLQREVPYEKVTGWELKREQGGTNALRCREKTGDLAHYECVARAALGVNHQQGSLL